MATVADVDAVLVGRVDETAGVSADVDSDVSESASADEGAGPASDPRTREVWAALAPVTDPELDESVTELGFVRSVSVDGTDVAVSFRLPTYWCAANFAHLMAADMHRAVRALAWVGSLRVELEEHMYADTINRGLAAGTSFSDTFGDEADGEIDEVRATFRRKAFQQRQESLLRELLAAGYSVDAVCGMPLGALDAVPDGATERVLSRYLEIRREYGGSAASDDRAFVTLDGDALLPATFDAYLLGLRRVRINTQFNGELCRGLLRARYGEDGVLPAAGAVHEVVVDFPAAHRSHQGTSA